MSFLAYVHRVSNTALSAYLTVLPEIAIRLMKDCPSEAVAMKRVLSSSFSLSPSLIELTTTLLNL